MEANIEFRAYALRDTWEYEPQKIIYIPSGFVSNDGLYVATLSYYSLEDLQNINAQWGLVGRILEGHRGGALTTAVISGFFSVEGIPVLVLGYGWSNGSPDNGSPLKVDILLPQNYIIGISENLFITQNDIIEDTIKVIKQIESLRKFDLRVSRASFEVTETEALNEFLNKYWTANKYNGSYHVIGVFINQFIDGLYQPKFFGYIEPDNIIYDKINGVYTFDCYDWIKFMQKTIWNNSLPDGYKNPNLSEFISGNVLNFYGISIEVKDIPQNWVYRDYLGYRELDNVYIPLKPRLTVNDFMVEIMKHYNAVFFYDGTGKFHCYNRNQFNSVFHEDENKIIETELIQSYKLRDYDSLLINVKGEWKLRNGVYINYEGWASIWDDDGKIGVQTGIWQNLSNLQKVNYLDLRQQLPDYDFDHRIFPARTREERYSDFQELLQNKVNWELTVDKMGYELFDTFVYGGKYYRIIYIEEDYYREESKIRMEQYA